MITDTNTMGAPPSEQRIEQRDSKSSDMDVDAEHEIDELEDSKPNKRRRKVKSLDKKYQCAHPDCGKAYSRAEHLYRHHLNHVPKHIYRCDFPGCDREFVRADLCARHKERHTAKGSHLQRKDAFLNSQRPSNPSGRTSPSGTATINASPVEMNHTYPPTSAMDGYMPSAALAQSYTSAPDQLQSSVMTELTPLNTASGMHLDPQLGPYSAYTGTVNGLQNGPLPQSAPADIRRYNYDTMFPARPASHVLSFGAPPTVAVSSMHPPPTSSPQSAGGAVFAQHPYPSPTSTSQTFRSPPNYSTLPSLPPFGFPQGYGPSSSIRSASVMSPTTVGSIDQHAVPNSGANSVIDFNVFDQLNVDFAMPVFDNNSFHRPQPSVVDEYVLDMLLSNNGMEINDPSPPEPEPVQTTPPPLTTTLPKVEPDGTKSDESLPSLTASLDINIRESTISEKKQQRLVAFVRNFSDIEQNPGRKNKAEFLAGDPRDPTHVMSLQMLKTYITSYWMHIHQQMPILHRPTFNPETCPDLLLLAMMCLGATCLERTHSMDLIKTSSELVFFITYHVRWEVFKDAEFRPTAKLWTFQTMLLLELFEKMFSTRALHERAHVHHATTLTVMRRGSSLIGRNALDSARDPNDPTRTPPGPDGTINTSGQNTPDAFWNRWITAEATRRAAFAAFVIDSTHATLFGHSAVMSPHDIRLPLPCDEALWSAQSSAQVQTVEASLAENGFKPTSFLDGLRKTLNGQKVRTNTFGRVILMAGLLNVSWHMNQRDLQMSSLGAAQGWGDKIKWRPQVTRAFDHWRRDFDESLSKNDHWLQVCNSKNNDRSSIDHRENVFESRTCLHSLAHMAMHVDMIDCQVFAGASSALGRIVTDVDRAAVQRRIRDWATGARARDATFYALKFIREALIPEEELTSQRSQPHRPRTFNYSARDDYLLNRPWVLFFAALIVWTYGYALDGPLTPSNYTLTAHEHKVADMQRYLIRLGSVAAPPGLVDVKDRNSCLGLLLLLRESFQQPRWELLHEASDTLTSCINLLTPGINSEIWQ